MNNSNKSKKTKSPKKLVAKTALLNGHYAPTEFYARVLKQIHMAMAEVKPDTLYTTKMLCGDDFWSDLPSNWWKVLAGRCFAHMVSTKQFPFEFVQYKRSCTKHYRLKCM